jgi:chromosome segregation protein
VNSDTVALSRYLSRDGNYWHQVNDRTVMKSEILRILERLSIDPDNMLIIMHQNMINVFGAIDAREKLRLVEEAVGIREYREQILEAQQKLSHTLSEEESIKAMLEKARETLRYWESEYERFKRKLELESRRRELELEHAWSRVARQEEVVSELASRLRELEGEVKEISGEVKEWGARDRKLERDLERLEAELEGQYRKVIERERMEAEHQGRAVVLSEVRKALSRLRVPELKTMEAEERRLGGEMERLRRSIEREESRLAELKHRFRETREGLMEARVRVAVLEFRKGLLEHELSEVRGELRRARRELEKLEGEASEIGARVETRRKPQEVLDEFRVVNARLATLTDISPDVERMYASYQATLRELEAKAREAEANRRKALEELELRKRRWREELERLLGEVRKEYQRFLERVGGTGDVGLVNPEDLECAGLELSVGFLGVRPQVLDAHTQSGGERTTASMCFLLALQRRIKSPLRAVDEFELHLDPRNREHLLRSVAELTGEDTAQYLLITPGRLVGVEKVANVITVQNVGGSSRVGVVV